MSKRPRSDARLLIIMSQSELNARESFMELTFEPTKTERLLLDLNARGGEFSPAEYRGVNADSALASYFGIKYGQWIWSDGESPLSEKREEEETDQEVLEFLQARRERRRKNYDWVLEDGYLDSDPSLVNEAMREYIDRLVAISADSEIPFENKEQRKATAALGRHHMFTL